MQGLTAAMWDPGVVVVAILDANHQKPKQTLQDGEAYTSVTEVATLTLC